MNTDIKNKLHKLALKKSQPFCYSCYVVCPTGTCPTCHSDDLMRHVDGVGVEYGTDWIIDHIIDMELKPIDVEEYLIEEINDCYGETTKVGWCEFNTAELIRDQDPTSWRCAVSDKESDMLEDDSAYIEIKGNIYYLDDVELLLDKNGITDEDEDELEDIA